MVCFQTMCKHVSVLLIILSLPITCMCDVPVCKTRTNLLLLPPSLQPHEIDVSSNQSRLELYVSKFSTSLIHLSVKQCIVPHAIIPSPAPSTVLGTPKAPPAHTYVVVRVGIISSELERRGLQLAIAVRLSAMSGVPSTLESTDLLIPYEIETSLEHQYDTFLFPIFPLWRFEKCRIILRKMSPQTKYSFYTGLHQVPAITDAERNRSPNLLDRYFLALGQPGASEDPKSVLQDLLDPDTLDTGSVKLIMGAAGKRLFQFETFGENTAIQMTFTCEHFPSTLSPTFTFALDAQLVIPQGSVDSFGCEICPALLNKLHIRNNSAEGHCLFITALHIEEQRVRSPSDADGNHLYPVLITVPWAEATMKLRRIEIRVKCDATSTLHYSIRPVGAFLINNEPPTSCPDLVHGGISSASGETVPTPGPHDTRDTTVSPVQPRSRGMGSLRAVVGALGAGRRSTSVVAAAVVRRGMPRPGRAGAWGTGRVALLVLGVVGGVALLLAAVALVLVHIRSRAPQKVQATSSSGNSFVKTIFVTATSTRDCHSDYYYDYLLDNDLEKYTSGPSALEAKGFRSYT